MITLQIRKEDLEKAMVPAICEAVLAEGKNAEVLRETIQWAANAAVRELVQNYIAKIGEDNLDEALRAKINEMIDSEVRFTCPASRGEVESMMDRAVKNHATQLVKENENEIIEAAVKAATDRIVRRGVSRVLQNMQSQIVGEEEV